MATAGETWIRSVQVQGLKAERSFGRVLYLSWSGESRTVHNDLRNHRAVRPKSEKVAGRDADMDGRKFQYCRPSI